MKIRTYVFFNNKITDCLFKIFVGWFLPDDEMIWFQIRMLKTYSTRTRIEIEVFQLHYPFYVLSEAIVLKQIWLNRINVFLLPVY